MPVGLIKKQIIHSNNSKPTPLKLFGSRRRREALEDAQGAYDAQMSAYKNFDIKNVRADAQNAYEGMENAFGDLQNAYKGLGTEFENVYEDLTVNQKQAEFMKQQQQQQQANIMSQMGGAAGASGVAGLAQAMANQGAIQAQQAAASIGQQEAQNQLAAAQGAAGVQQMEAAREEIIAGGQFSADIARMQGEQATDIAVRGGEQWAQEQQMVGASEQQAMEMSRQSTMLGMAQQQVAGAQEQINANTQMWGNIAGGALSALSDIRLKENISKTGVSESGIPIYTFSYKGDDTVWSGTMAQDLIELGREDAVTIMDNGYYGVYYDMIDINMKQLNNK